MAEIFRYGGKHFQSIIYLLFIKVLKKTVNVVSHQTIVVILEFYKRDLISGL